MNPDAPFDEPWQVRLFATTQAAIDGGAIDRETFRRGLTAAIDEAPDRGYWESWLEALDRLVG